MVRPDGLINAEISNYEVVATPPQTIFNGLTTTRANVAHFMCECIEQPNLWIQWKGKMPVVDTLSYGPGGHLYGLGGGTITKVPPCFIFIT